MRVPVYLGRAGINHATSVPLNCRKEIDMDQYCINCSHCVIDKRDGKFDSATCSDGKEVDILYSCKLWEYNLGWIDIREDED